jgi:release factor glutamine methyltransferase
MARQIKDYIEEISLRLQSASETPGLDAQVLLAHILDTSRTWVLSHPDSPLPREHIAELDQAVGRLARGEPLPYVLGHWEFFGLDFLISPVVLIPRPETELLVEHALEALSGTKHALIADVGTGCGCISVSIAKHNQDVKVFASDISASALAIARRNASRHKVENRTHFVQANLLSAYRANWGETGIFSLICGNLPYIPTETLAPLKVLRWEPEIALWGGADGLFFIRKTLSQSRGLVAPGGRLLLEIEASLGNQAVAVASDFYPQARVSIKKDLAGNDRLIVIEID